MTQTAPDPQKALVTLGTLPMPATRDNVVVMDRFVQIMDPNAPQQARWGLAVIACRLGLHPLNNEVILYEGKPYITIAGLRRLAERTGDLAAVQPWIVTDPQLRTDLGAVLAGDIVAGCNVFRKSSDIPTVQYGIVRQHERWPSTNEMTKMGVSKEEVDQLRAANNPDGLFALIKSEKPPKIRPVILQPQTMAMKRAEARGLSSLAGVPVPVYDTETAAPITTGAVPRQLMEADDGSQPPPEASPAAAAAGEQPWQPGEGPVAPTQDPQAEDPEDPPPAGSQGSLMGGAAPTGGPRE